VFRLILPIHLRIARGSGEEKFGSLEMASDVIRDLEYKTVDDRRASTLLHSYPQPDLRCLRSCDHASNCRRIKVNPILDDFAPFETKDIDALEDKRRVSSPATRFESEG
jgi:hypothetical protein